MSSPTALPFTYGMIKPDAYSKQDEIFSIIKENGFKIVQMKQMTCTPEKLGLFYREHEGKHFFNDLVAFMSSGPIVAMILSKENAVPEWRKLIGIFSFYSSYHSQLITNFTFLGPTNSNKAREDGSKNAVHGSANEADARREINFFFPNFVIDPFPTSSETSSYLQMNVIPLLSDGLLELCKIKPENPVVCFFIFHICVLSFIFYFFTRYYLFSSFTIIVIYII